MHLVTLTTDRNKDDFYTGAIKGMLLSADRQVQIITITNQITPYNISEAAFIIRNCYTQYPPGTIHLISVSADYDAQGRFLAARMNGQILLCADNGIMGLLGDTVPEEVYDIDIKDKQAPGSFPGLNVLGGAASALLKGSELSSLGEAVSDYMQPIPLRATIENNSITGSVIYLDSYGNAITNITKELFERIGKDKPFTIYVQSKHYRISQINSRYSDSGPADLLALFNSVGLIEIAIRNGSAKKLLNLNTDSTIRVEFRET